MIFYCSRTLEYIYVTMGFFENLNKYLENIKSTHISNEEMYKMYSTSFKNLITSDVDETDVLFDFQQPYDSNKDYKTIMMETPSRIQIYNCDYDYEIMKLTEDFIWILLKEYHESSVFHVIVDPKDVTEEMIDYIIENEKFYAFCLIPTERVTQEMCNKAFECGFDGAAVSTNYKYIPDKFKTLEMATWLLKHLDATDAFLLDYFPPQHQAMKEAFLKQWS